MNLSVIIPSRSPEYLQKTIDDLLLKAEGEIEVIVVLDGIWPSPPIKEHKSVIILHHGGVHNSVGMRDSINYGVRVSSGKYIMKTDEHCMFDKGFDVKLSQDCEDDWLVVPRRHRLEPEAWKIVEDGRPPVDYMTIDYPYQRPNDKTCGLHGSENRQLYNDRKDILIDDLMTMQGSCWFMSRKLWDKVIKDLDSFSYGPFTQEAQELCNKIWFSGGRCVVNKKTWYAHYHKGKRGKGYSFSNRQYDKHMEGTEKGRLFCIDYWLNTKDYNHDWEWFLKKFWPVPTWPENWKEQLEIDKQQAYIGINQVENKN